MVSYDTSNTGTPADFLELMPHRITARDNSKSDDYGYPVAGAGTRVHVCLIEERFGVAYGQAGAAPSVQRMAYLNPYPVQSEDSTGVVFQTTPQPITTSTTIVLPDGTQRRVTNINNNYDETGILFVQLVTYD
jgi:hypothetical protein